MGKMSNYMNFYCATYKKQIYDNGWKDTDYNSQGIIVIANSYDEAKLKVEKCLLKVETEKEYCVNWNGIGFAENADCTNFQLTSEEIKKLLEESING